MVFHQAKMAANSTRATKVTQRDSDGICLIVIYGAAWDTQWHMIAHDSKIYDRT